MNYWLLIPLVSIEIFTYFLSITWWFYNFYWNCKPISLSNESIGESVPDVRIIVLGFKSEISFMPTAGLKHQNPNFL